MDLKLNNDDGDYVTKFILFDQAYTLNNIYHKEKLHETNFKCLL